MVRKQPINQPINIMEKRFKWLVLIGAFMTVLTTCGLLQSIGLFVVEWQEEFDVSAEEIGWIGSCFIFGYAAAGLLIATISSLVNCRGVTMFGGATACICLSLAYLTSTPWHLCLVMMITGFGLGCALTGSLTVVGFYFESNEGVVNGIMWAGGTFGLLILPPLLRYLIDLYSWKGAMLVSAGIVANLCVYGALFRSTKMERLSSSRNTPPSSDVQCEKEITDNQSYSVDVRVNFNQEHCHGNSPSSSLTLGSSESLSSFQEHTHMESTKYIIFSQIKGLQRYPIVKLCMNSRAMLHYASQFLKGFGHYAALVYFISLAVDNNISKNRGTFLLSLMGVTGTTVRLTHGILLDKKLITPIHLQSVSLVIGGGSCLLIAVSHSLSTFTAFALIFGSCCGVYNVMSPVILREIVEVHEIQAAIALGLSANFIGSLAGLPIVGTLFDATQDYAASYYASGSMLIASGLFHLADHLLPVNEGNRRRTFIKTSNVS